MMLNDELKSSMIWSQHCSIFEHIFNFKCFVQDAYFTRFCNCEFYCCASVFQLFPAIVICIHERIALVEKLHLNFVHSSFDLLCSVLFSKELARR